jgi:hypothetical protein
VPQGPRGDHPAGRALTETGDCIAIHFDARAPAEAYDQIRDALKDPQRHLCQEARQMRLGGVVLVQASLLGLEAAVEAFPRATHFYMLSGDCMAIKSAEYAHEFLDATMSTTSKASISSPPTGSRRA